MYLIFDTETTGLPKSWNAPITDTDNWPRCIQIAWQLHDAMGNLIEHRDFLIKPDGFNIPFDAERIHGISTELAQEQGISLEEGLALFNQVLQKTSFVVGQNVSFDINILGCEFHRLGIQNNLTKLPFLDTCTEKSATLCKLSGGRGGKFKLPTLTELHKHLFAVDFEEAHNATADVEATTRCFLELIRLKEFTKEELKVDESYFENFKIANPTQIQVIGIKHVNLKSKTEKIRKRLENLKDDITSKTTSEGLFELKDTAFSHLHNHTQFSVLQSTIQIDALVRAAAQDKMPAVAMTDSGNMMAAFHFVNTVLNHNKLAEHEIKPIVGCEFNICEDHKNKSIKDNGFQVVMLAKNKKGYYNLAKMSSIAFIDGFYYVPRIDKEVVKKYKEDIIVLSGNLYGEIPSKILNLGEHQAEEALIWWKQEFQDDFYLEIMRHNQQDETIVNETLLKFSEKHNVKIVATNNTFYLDKKDANAHDILLCVKDGEKQATPVGKGRGYRYGLPNEEYYFKSTDEMKKIFADIPKTISNVQEIVDKIEIFSLAREVLLPAFDIPKEFQSEEDLLDGGKRGENNYLRHLTYEGAKKRYGELSDSIIERIDFELEVIKKTGYPGYFLIVEDFIREARNMDVSVGPGRGSAAGSVVAFCLKITNIDPIKYDLLFERFLNPERVSMPDIDIDFDDEGRSKVLDYVIKKYGSNQVAQIITYGTMAAKSSIRDTARVLDLPLFEADRIAKLIPNIIKLQHIFSDDEKNKSKINSLREEEKLMVDELRTISKGENLASETVNKATILEGSVRNTGTHACGVIITPGDITNYVPVALAKDSDMYVTQFDNSVVESAGLLKMDFLGLKTLTLIKDTVKIVKARHGIELDPETFPLDDEKTYQLFQKGETVGVFQYESVGMQKHMRALKPTVFGDLIAMNALYRPGPMEYIPSFINRKHGTEDIEYDLPAMEEYLAETYGITVYQEQVMLLSQKLANFSKGEADVLRKAMGKKQMSVLDKMKPKFIEQASANGHDATKLEKIWKDWEAFASYAFNKSHSTCYAWIAYQTAYLKAHYPAEYMASVLSNNMSDIRQISFFMEECKRMGLQVLGPDINESYLKFSVNKQGAVRFGMAAIKGVGAHAVKSIIDERKENGSYASIFDLAKRADLRVANKKAFDSLVKAGAFDSFTNTHRAQYFALDEKGVTFLERAMKYGSKFQENKNSTQVSLFGETSTIQFPEPEIPNCETWGTMELLSQEKEVIGMYISAHPLDDFKNELFFCNTNLSIFREDLKSHAGKNISFAGIITDVQHRVAKTGNPWASFVLEDYNDNYEFRIFKEDYLKFKHFLSMKNFLFIRATFKKNFYNDEVSISFTDFKLLTDVLDNCCEKLTIQIPLDEIKEDTILNLETILKNNPGTKPLKFTIWDEIENIEVNLPSRNIKIEVSSSLLDILQKQQINYKLN
ncbi:MAG: DNA polymerase III subunit alpha [Flavobacteriia bacterium]|nr:DNA polymerase III subunit alpha [Flavobacteriia bacterium]OIP45696.1 MAG: DNA polymerase III subunit alpha [Flavobacteriaceae bacterium CG2_30_31_66]PIV97131.1 MAG: DNA polymerase III subunit alpha [Flavobacteriaceae bacterium CG17_big_fil_post_rev_8_21_14_2_50_31_13]PIX11435.1 MAG: DNA polymerase III subunit alpha [Flavobacteriaceae bacterium CG_4_8_14_3_um_filter_31_8]PIY14850.1 MAG: DNA polymerase III subunit alpha [Flavobacteriaceae bacterium CG_4_10_14_3_um_filter_31_253]PIZ09577.1 MA